MFVNRPQLPDVIVLPYIPAPPLPGQPGYQPAVSPAAATDRLKFNLAPEQPSRPLAADVPSSPYTTGAELPSLGLLQITDPEVIAAAERYLLVSTEYNKLEKERKILNEKLKKAMGDHASAVAGSRVLSLGFTPASELVITEEMVGTTRVLRAASRPLKVA